MVKNMCRMLIMYANFLNLMQMVASKCKYRIHAVKKAAMSQLETKLEKYLDASHVLGRLNQVNLENTSI